jgi:hypothetical protein
MYLVCEFCNSGNHVDIDAEHVYTFTGGGNRIIDFTDADKTELFKNVKYLANEFQKSSFKNA